MRPNRLRNIRSDVNSRVRADAADDPFLEHLEIVFGAVRRGKRLAEGLVSRKPAMKWRTSSAEVVSRANLGRIL